MSTIKNGQISLYCHFNKIIKGPVTSFQSPAFKRYKHKCNVHYVAMPMMTSQILRSADFIEIQKSRYLENETLFFLQIKKLINNTSRVTLWQKNTFVAEVTFN